MSILSDELNLPVYSGLTNEEAAVAINAKTVHELTGISSSDIKAYLSVVDKRLTIIDSADIAARKATLALDDFDFFDMASPAYNAKLTAVLVGLVTAELISETDKSVILGMGDDLTSKAAQLGLGLVREGHIAEARL